MASFLMRKANRSSLRWSRTLLCRYCSNTGDHCNNDDAKSADNNKKDSKRTVLEDLTRVAKETHENKGVVTGDGEELPVAADDDDPNDPWIRENVPDVAVARVKRHLKWMRAVYKDSGMEVVYDDTRTGIIRKKGVTGHVFPAVEEQKSISAVLGGTVHGYKKSFLNGVPDENPILVPRETDIAVIGGGIIGAAVAYFLKRRNPMGYNVHVIEKDSTYTQAATVLSVGGIRQQFSLPENIQMSLYTAEFFRNIKEHLSIENKQPPDIQFHPQGYLFLATEDGAPCMEENYKTQREEGAAVELLSNDMLHQRFPWMNLDGIVLGSYGTQNEGWFDPWTLLTALRAKATHMGAVFVRGEVIGSRYENSAPMIGDFIKRLDMLEIQGEDGNIYPMRFHSAVNCAGPWAGDVGRCMGIGIDDNFLRVPIPIEPRKRYVFVVQCPEGPGLDMPVVVDPSGLFVRREGLGGFYICGMSPDPENIENYRVNHKHQGVEPGIFEELMLPKLRERIPSFKSVTLKSAWAGFYDYNYFDQNLILGNHPHHWNFYIAAGCSGHGIQQAPAIGNAIAELIVSRKSGFEVLDLSRLSFDRILKNEPIPERGII